MCGIFCYTGKDALSNLELLSRLQRLEYRGYDSFGLGYVKKVTGKKSRSGFNIEKQVGKVSDHLDNISSKSKLNTAISHTRWATHGMVNEVNTHPHVSYDGSVCLVHNGVIENHEQIKTYLIDKGISFNSDTDTEVISNLLSYTFNQIVNLKQTERLDGLQTCLRQLKGSYAIAFIHLDTPDVVFYAKKGSPLVIGSGNKEKYISSDIYTFIDCTDNVMYLTDGDYGYVSKDSCARYSLNDCEPQPVNWTVVNACYDQVELGDYRHYMIKEICEQQNIIDNTVRNQNPVELGNIVSKIKTSRRVVFSACGSSYYASMVGANLLRSIGVLAECVLSSEFKAHEQSLHVDDLVICVSQSGETADIIESIHISKERGCTVISIVNIPNSSIDRLSDNTLYVNAGPELCVLSTKSFTSQVAMFLSVWEKISGGKLPLDAYDSSIFELVAESTRSAIHNIAKELHTKEHIYCLGRGEQHPVALEAALKIKEVSYIHAEGFAGGELKHGSIALIEPGTPCILFVTKQHELELLANGAELKSRGAMIIGVAESDDELYDHFIRVSEFEQSGPLLQIIPIQLLAYNLALFRGLDPDKPRNLAKSVTVK